jgi:hypothetical protein
MSDIELNKSVNDDKQREFLNNLLAAKLLFPIIVYSVSCNVDKGANRPHST